MTAAANLIYAVSFAQLVRGVFFLSMLTGLILFFRPLLKGIARALVLSVRPRMTKEALAARRKLHDARVQGVIISANSPVDAAKLGA
jgi:hypothetical protein